MQQEKIDDPPRILFVDPYIDGWPSYLAMFRERGMPAVAVATGEEAVAVAERDHPTVVVVDLSLGIGRKDNRREDTVRALETIVTLGRSTPAPGVVAVSAAGTGDTELRLSTGPVRILPKDDAPGVLAAVLAVHAARQALTPAGPPR